MPSRRYYIATLPVAHINGKLAPVSVKCSNFHGEKENDGFFYGYRHRVTPHISRYAVRKKSRNLQTNPMTAGENDRQRIFSVTSGAVNDHLADTEERQLCLADFKKQSKYATLRGFAFAECWKEDGRWPQEWTKQE